MPRITVLQPEGDVPLDRFQRWLTEAGARLRVVDLGTDPVPAVDAVGDGLLLLGGRMSVASDLPWVEPVRQLLVDATDAGLPVLGICLGHQLLADALGGTVVVGHPIEGEEGVVVLDWTDAAASDPSFGEVVAAGRRAPTSHHDAVTVLPPGAVLLASSADHPHQAFRVGASVGVQFHPEASPALVERWVSGSGGDGAAARGALEAVDDEVVSLGRATAEWLVRSLESAP